MNNLKQLVKKSRQHNPWDLTNKTLYELCETYPNHKSLSEITAKVFIIGRSYAAALERRRNKHADATDDFYFKKAAPVILKSNIDRNLNTLRKMSKIDHEDILKTHKDLTDTFTKISGLEKRSLASKYLHFHVPDLFFIYDSRALKGLVTITSKYTELRKKGVVNDAFDKNYAGFYYRCCELQAFIQNKTGVNLTPRQLDNFLLLIETKNKK